MAQFWQKSCLTLGARLDGQGDLLLTPDDRESHTYIAGATRTGKSKLIEHLIRQDIGTWRKHRCGMLLLDPHGEVYREVMRAVAARGKTDIPIVPIDLTDSEYIVSYNALRKQQADVSAIVNGFVGGMAHVWGESNTNNTPRFERWAANLLHALYQLDQTLAEAPLMLSMHDPSFRQTMLPHLSGSALEHWQWACQMTRNRFEEQAESTVNRMKRFQETEKLKLMLGTCEPSFDFNQAMDEGWIVLVNLSTEGAWAYEDDANTLATLMLTDLWTTAKARGKGKDKRPFRVVIDEFQNFITPTIAKNLAQAAGFGLHMTLATQFPTQLLSAGSVGEDIYRNVMGNARSKIVFSLEEADSLKALSEWLFRGVIDPDEIKDEIYATRAVDYKIITLRGSSETSTSTTSDGTTTSWDEDGNEIASSSRDQSSDGTSYAELEHETIAPVYDKELTSRERRSIDEQFFRATQQIVNQDQRYAYVRTMSMKKPVPIRTPDVKKAQALDPVVKEHTHWLLERLPFAMRVEAARKQLAERQAVISRQTQGFIDEPETAKRILPEPPIAPGS